jgi:glyoxylase I family protein
MIKQIAHVCIKTKNLKKTLAFYQHGLGFKIQFRFIRNRRIFGYYLSCGKRTFMEIFEDKTLNEGPQTGLISHLCFEVSSIREIEKRLKQKKIKHAESKLGADNSWQLWVEDPNRVKMEFHQYTKKSCQLTKGDCIIA